MMTTRRALGTAFVLLTPFAWHRCGRGGEGAAPDAAVDAPRADAAPPAPDVAALDIGLPPPDAPAACDEPPTSCFSESGVRSGGQCRYEPRDGVTCDDGLPCSTDDSCTAGVCRGQAPACCDDFSCDASCTSCPGFLHWVRIVGRCRSTDLVSTLLASPDGGYFVAGLTDEAVFGEGEANETSVRGVFVARHESDGTLRWARSMFAGGSWISGIGDIALGPDGEVAVLGYHDSLIIFDWGEANETLLLPSDFVAQFVALYGPNGEFLWAVAIGGGWSGGNIGFAGDGSIVVGTWFGGDSGRIEDTAGAIVELEVGLGCRGGDRLIARFAANGQVLWARALGDCEPEWERDPSPYLTAVAGPDGGATLMSYCDGRRAFCLHGVGPDGEPTWSAQGGASDSFPASKLTLRKLTERSVLASGTFSGTATFPAGDGGTTTLNPDGAGGEHRFIAEYSTVDGTLFWVRSYDTEVPEDIFGNPWHPIVAADGSLVVAAPFPRFASEDGTPGAYGAVTFNRGEPDELTIAREEGCPYDGYVVRYGFGGRLLSAAACRDAPFGLGAILTDHSLLIGGTFYFHLERAPIILGAGQPNETTLYRDCNPHRETLGDIVYAKYAL